MPLVQAEGEITQAVSALDPLLAYYDAGALADSYRTNHWGHVEEDRILMDIARSGKPAERIAAIKLIESRREKIMLVNNLLKTKTTRAVGLVSTPDGPVALTRTERLMLLAVPSLPPDAEPDLYEEPERNPE